MSATSQLEEATIRHAAAVEEMEAMNARLQQVNDDTDPEDVAYLNEAFEKADAETKKLAAEVSRFQAIVEAKRSIAPAAKPEKREHDAPNGLIKVEVGEEPLTYRKGGQHSFFRDLVQAGNDPTAAQRLSRHDQEMRVEMRADVNTDGNASGFVPPIYLADRWIDVARAGRPFADKVGKIPLEADGMRMDFPVVISGTGVASQDGESTSVEADDIDSDLYSVPVRTIAGQNDISMQSFERTRPGLDEVILRDLLRAYDSELDRQLLAGTGNNGQHKGLRALSSPNPVSFSSGDGGDLLAAVYEAVSDIATNAPGYMADAIVMHPRRAAWLANTRDDKFPLFQQGGLFRGVGTQDAGFAGTFAGLPVIADANIGVTYGSSTNEDEIYVVVLDQLLLAEGQVRSRVLSEVLSDDLKVRIQIFSYSAFAGGRREKTVSVISGAGLVTPTFTSP